MTAVQYPSEKAAPAAYGSAAYASPAGPTGPVKTYKVVNPATFTHRHFEIHASNSPTNPVLWTNIERRMFHQPQINLQVDAENGPIVAAAKLRSFTRDFEYYPGNPDCTDPNHWIAVQAHGFTSKHYVFGVAGRVYCWKRTHDEQYGGRAMNSQTFKLVEGDGGDKGGKVLMVYVETRSIFGRVHAIADINFYVNMDVEIEKAALIVIFGLQEDIRRRRKNNSASAAAAC